MLQGSAMGAGIKVDRSAIRKCREEEKIAEYKPT